MVVKKTCILCVFKARGVISAGYLQLKSIARSVKKKRKEKTKTDKSRKECKNLTIDLKCDLK